MFNLIGPQSGVRGRLFRMIYSKEEKVTTVKMVNFSSKRFFFGIIFGVLNFGLGIWEVGPSWAEPNLFLSLSLPHVPPLSLSLPDPFSAQIFQPSVRRRPAAPDRRAGLVRTLAPFEKPQPSP